MELYTGGIPSSTQSTDAIVDNSVNLDTGSIFQLKTKRKLKRKTEVANAHHFLVYFFWDWHNLP